MLQLLYSLLVPFLFFFFNDTATTEIYTLSLHDALPICYPIDIISVLLVLCALSIQLSSLIYKWPWYTLIPILFLVRGRSEEHTSELQSQSNLVCRLLLEKKHTTRTSEDETVTEAHSPPT